VLPFARTVQDIDELGFKPEARRKLMRDNVLRIYGLS
jgi:predicted TIM-barrel fold metal-dependent hydrolase